MTNTNTTAFVTLLNDTVRDPKPTAAGFKIVYIGKDKYPLSVLEMTPVEADRWKKSALFESLSATIRGWEDMQNTADLVIVMSQEIPIDVTSVFIESSRAKADIIASTKTVCNLSNLAFLHSNGQKAGGEYCDLIDRCADLT